MKKDGGKEIFKKFLKIKKDSGAIFYDTHVHPMEVFGIENKQPKDYSDKNTYGPSLLEKLKYSNFSLSVLRLLFYFTPQYIRGEISKKFVHINQDSLLRELELAGINKATLLPVYPYANPEKIYSDFKSEKFIHLGSLNLDLDTDDIKQSLQQQIDRYSIVGLKLHPNIQNFYPIPELNDVYIREKLEKAISVAKDKSLYLLFHGGLSFAPEKNSFVKKEYALIDNFLNHTDFLKTLGVPIVIAHLGFYNVKNPNIKKLGSLMEIPNLYFDTAGVNPKYVEEFLNLFGPDRLIFGSDAPYFNMRYNLIMILGAIYEFDNEEFEKNVLKIFSENYDKIILNKCST